MDQRIDYGEQPACAVFSDDIAGGERWHLAVSAVGGRTLLSSDVVQAGAILDDMAYPDVVLLDVVRDSGRDLDALLLRLDAAAAEGRFSTVVAFTPDLIDPVCAAISHPDVMLLCDPSPIERAAALGLAIAVPSAPALRERGDGPPKRLRQLSEEVSRIARALAELSRDEPTAMPMPPPGALLEGVTLPSVATIRSVIRGRRLRDQFFDAELFADPAWDMLLDLMVAQMEQRNVAVSSLCIAASVPPTTALRWIKRLHDMGLFVRTADPRDGRRVFVDLAPAAVDALANNFRAIERAGVLAT
ncbi:winged helix DNA-binding protein [Sphingomonas nostoxanthinifaciens]|uniref:winged helix DNA-binding protein n=1 Tax=Sphingomonas nostoxanthinifaciens TaxID=2872652 RepID=UPI001CC1CA92|nr:winged helix DNA-binding protein [Sphingomonas nostoxanthinifaciens]UAK22822.1 winged helix DNA-binding protein [Sphingomonas nostoxanthinifaciens]